jgi:hypothetical protein
LWLSDSLKTNDAFELKWIFQLARELEPQRIEQIIYLESIYDLFLKSFYRPHMICFSKNGDLLSQWRGYADDGKGVSLGFRRKYFNKIKNVENLELKFFEVGYNNNVQKKAVKSILNNSELDSKINRYISKQEKTQKDLFELLPSISELYKYGINFKNPAFVEERELRIIHGYPEVAAEPDIFQFRFTNDNLISYIEIPINLENNSPMISEIIIGPKSRVKEDELKMFLGQNIPKSGDIKISKSKSSYRHI